MKRNITPVTLIIEKNRARIVNNTLFKVKLLALVIQVELTELSCHCKEFLSCANKPLTEEVALLLEIKTFN